MADKSSESNSTSPFIDATSAMQAYIESRNWLRLYFDPLDEFERIARNKPSAKIDPALPRVTDGTMAAIIQETPRRVIQQLATGIITSRDNPEYAAIADVIHRHRLLPLYNRMGTALQKHWNMLSSAMIYGSSASYTFFTKTDNQWHTDFIIPYRKDILTEKGKVYGPDSNVIFMRSWYQKSDLKAIIAREKALLAADKNYKSEWDLKLLADFMNGSTTAKPADQMTPAEKEKGGDNGGYEVIHAFQKGQNAEFYSFSPHFKDGQNLRTKINSDPRGKVPIDFEYCNIDLSNPLGRGQVELSGGVQNLIDQQMQMFQFMSTIEMAPPLKVRGQVDKSRLKLRPGALWDMGTSPNNDVEPYVISNYALQNFGNNYGLLKSQISALNNTTDMTTSSETGAASSKTSAGVKNQQQRIGVTDNYLEKQHEQWYGAQSETSVNLFFAEMKGKEEISLGKDDINTLQSTYAAKLIKDDKLTVDYNAISNVSFNFKTDPSSSQEIDDQDQLEKIQTIIQEYSSNALVMNWFLGQAGKKFNVGELYQQQFERLGLKKLDQILVDMDDQEAAAAKQAPFPIIDKPQIRLTGQIPNGAMGAALGAGGVQVPPQIGSSMQENIDFGDILKDPATPASVKEWIYQLIGAPVQPGEIQMQQQQQAGSTGPSPAELAMRQQELAIKQQNANDQSTRLAFEIQKASHESGAKEALDIANTAHQHTIDLHNAALAAAQPQQTAQQPAQSQPAESPVEDRLDAAQNIPEGSQQDMRMDQQPQEGPQDQQYDQAHNLQEGTLQDIQHDLSTLDPQETQLVEQLLHRGYNESDIEQIIVMVRKGMPLDQVLPIIGGKYA